MSRRASSALATWAANSTLLRCDKLPCQRENGVDQ
jgi:hypothetical protein